MLAMAEDWHTVSLHEGGHYVVGHLLGLPVFEAWLTYHRHGWFGEWVVVGRTELGTHRGDTAVVDDDTVALFTLAGLEAEAMWVAHRDGYDLPRVREVVCQRPINLAGDVAELQEYLTTATITLEQAREWVHTTLLDHWGHVEEVAERLREHGSVPGRSQIGRGE